MWEKPLTEFVWELWELVDVLAAIPAVGNTEAKVEIEALEKLVSEVVPLNHAEAADGPISHSELNPIRQIVRLKRTT